VPQGQVPFGRVEIAAARKDDLPGAKPGAEARLPKPRGTALRHPAQIARAAGFGRVQIAMGVEPENAGAGMMPRDDGQGGKRGGTAAGCRDRDGAARQNGVDPRLKLAEGRPRGC